MEVNRIASAVLFSLVIVASGCASITGPNPEVVSTSSEQGLIGSFTGDGTITATIVNDGSAGEVEIIVEFMDDQGNIVGTTRESIAMGEGERREIEIETPIPEDSASYNVKANPR